ncbi:glycosyltransferase family 2 protein [Oleiagrimonas soli]|uniref:Glycosyl transferase n=1 Tax=Oleiagrimonas soli TaxID=1543381 RepID=A0A099CTE7_9GAMM|nr:glycosyltransferase family 2 protein [Oleiagrimonas soli]KGI77253.1 glycosyl transferase [Oleiagrimonas soli]MBB6185557.1 glycosyltransferase involved in cell wall biosynthesis [Oleiagrimonas soli]
MISIILPAKNEAVALAELLPHLRSLQPEAEIIVVDDGSSDDTAALCLRHDVQCLSSPYSMGNGAAVKRGARAARGDVLVFMDADGQHDPNDIPKLLAKLDDGFDMAVGARDWEGQAGVGRGVANGFYNWLASRITGHRVRDLTSGFRAVRADKFRQFLYLLPNGFSYPTTSTMAFFRSAYGVAYVPIKVGQRDGTTSHIKPMRDGLRFLLIIFKIATLYSPLKLFVPASGVFFALGCINYGFTAYAYGRLTNMSTLLWSAAVIVFLIGLVSEQITGLLYRSDE